jgi:hypothetical protein
MRVYSLLMLFFIIQLSSCKLPEEEIEKEINYDLDYKEVFNSRHAFGYDIQERMEVIITSKEEEEAFLNSMTINVTPFEFPEIDYENKMLIGIVYPQQGSGSNILSIPQVKVENGIIKVYSEMFIPMIGTDDIGYPVIFGEINKTDLEINFKETKVINEAQNFEQISGKWSFVSAYKVNENGDILDEIDALSIKDGGIPTFEINYSEVNGTGVCNTFGAEIIELNPEEGTINIKMGFSTRMFCGEFEQDFYDGLDKSTIFELNNNNLILKGNYRDLKYNKWVFVKSE